MALILVRDRTLLLVYALLGAWGYFNYGFGPALGLLRDEQGVSRGVASLHGTAFALGSVVGGALAPSVVRRFGRPAAMWGGLALAGLAIVAFCLARPLPLTLLFACAIPAFGMLLLAGVVAGLSDHAGPAAPAAISEANAVACGLGAVAPLAIGGTVALGLGWRPGLGVVVLLFGVLGVLAWLLRIRLPAVAATAPPRGRLPRAYWRAFALIATLGSVEATVNLWAADLLRSRTGMSPGDAAAAVSAIVAGMCLGRIVGGRLALRYGTIFLLLAAIGLSFGGFAVFWLATVPAVGVLGLVVTGLGNALHYPLGISLALASSAGQPDLAAGRSAYTMAISFGVAPFVLGGLADRVGVRWAFLLVPVLLGVGAALVLTIRRAAVRLAGAGTPPVEIAAAIVPATE